MRGGRKDHRAIRTNANAECVGKPGELVMGIDGWSESSGEDTALLFLGANPAKRPNLVMQMGRASESL